MLPDPQQNETRMEKITSAYVEIIFDNSDGRIPVRYSQHLVSVSCAQRNPVFIFSKTPARWSFAEPLDKKRMSFSSTTSMLPGFVSCVPLLDTAAHRGLPTVQADVTQMLESAGFSQSNPYYIVEQGRVQALCTMKDADRLAMLKEVAGTSVYDAKRSESIRILEENEGKRKHVDEVIAYLDERLAELGTEQKELTEWQACDKERRAIQYALHSEDLARAKRRLEELTQTHGQDQEASIRLQRELAGLSHEQATAVDSLESLQARQRAAEAEHESLQTVLEPLTERRVAAEGAVTELDSAVQEDAAGAEQVQALVEATMKRIADAKAELQGRLKPAFSAAEAKFQAAKAAADVNQSMVDAVYERSARGTQFKNAAQRDKWIKARVKELQLAASSKRANQEDAAAEAADASAQGLRCASEAAAAEAESAACEARLQNAKGEADAVRAQLSVAVQEARVAHGTQDSAERALAEASEGVARSKGSLDRITPGHIRSGLAELRRLVTQEGWTGIHGPIIDIVRAEDTRFDVAAEVIARHQMFNVVVDDATVASKCIAHLTRTKAGRVTFIPLSQVDVPEVGAPPNAEDAIPLIDKLRYDEHLRPAVMSVFGRALLCRDLETARRYAGSMHMTCVTLEGDEVSAKGVIYGGFQSVKENRLACKRTADVAAAALQRATEHAQEAQQAVLSTDQTTTAMRGRLEALTEAQSSARKRLEECRGNFVTLTREAAELEARAARASDRSSKLHVEHEALQGQVKALHAELGTDLVDGIGAADRKALEAAQRKSESLAESLASATATRDAARASKAAAEAELHEHLEKRLEELRSRLGVDQGGTGADDAAARQGELAAAREAATAAESEEADVRARLGALEKDLGDLRKKVATATSAMDSLNMAISGITEQMANTSRDTEKALQKRATATRQRDAAMSEIRSLGALPAGLDKYEGRGRRELLKELTGVTERLRAFDHVNKKALDQFSNFTEQREALVSRRAELTRAAGRIRELVAHLDAKKDEAILRTFKGVAKHFKRVFGELVPKGSGTMVIKRAFDPADEDEDSGSVVTDGFDASEGAPSEVGKGGSDDTEEDAESTVSSDIMRLSKAVDSFRGVAIKVSFTDAGESLNMKRLSGGQKALVALALIFAIQRCDPAPFYLFDEIDSALDDTHRAAVANLVHRQTLAEENAAQFITSTFRPELVFVADTVFGVIHQHGVSHIVRQSRDAALDFINAMQQEGGAQGAAPHGAQGHVASIARMPASAMGDLDATEATAGGAAAAGNKPGATRAPGRSSKRARR